MSVLAALAHSGYLAELLAGMAVNLQIAATALALGLALGLPLGLMQLGGRMRRALVTPVIGLMRVAPTFVVMFFLMLYLLFFVLRDGGQILQRLHQSIPLPDEQERQLFDKFSEVARATVN